MSRVGCGLVCGRVVVSLVVAAGVDVLLEAWRSGGGWKVGVGGAIVGAGIGGIGWTIQRLCLPVRAVDPVWQACEAICPYLTWFALVLTGTVSSHAGFVLLACVAAFDIGGRCLRETANWKICTPAVPGIVLAIFTDRLNPLVTGFDESMLVGSLLLSAAAGAVIGMARSAITVMRSQKEQGMS